MKLYLVRHGSYSAPNTLLNAEGVADISRLANHLGKLNLSVSTIFHSSKPRAQQTAKIIADAINRGQCEQLEGLEPSAPTLPILKMINSQTKDLMLVSHLPFLGKLTAQLFFLDADTSLIDYQPGTLACFSNDTGLWNINWVLPPQVF